MKIIFIRQCKANKCKNKVVECPFTIMLTVPKSSGAFSLQGALHLNTDQIHLKIVNNCQFKKKILF